MKGNYQDQLLWQPQGLKRTLLLTIVVKNKTTCLSLTPGQVKFLLFFKKFSEKCWKLAKNLKNIFSKIEKLFLKIIISFKVDQQPQQLLQMKTRMTSFTLEPTLLRKKSNLDGVHPHLATPMGGVNPLPKLEIGNNPHLM